MEDSDLRRNFKMQRDKYWIKQGLWIPSDLIVVFEKIKRTEADIGKPRLVASYDGVKTIRIMPEMAYVYVAVHTALLHEMAHVYVAYRYRDCRRSGHGKTFHAEIDRLYALGAFRKLI